MDQKAYRALKQKSTLHFKEHILAGYSGKQLEPSCQIEDLSSLVRQKTITLPSGAVVIELKPIHRKSNVLVSLHGGPESFESTEIRYLGLYRDLLRLGWTIYILNYRGSSQIHFDSKLVWQNWKPAILKDFSELLSTFSLKGQKINLLGASFGGALALLIHQKFKIRKCVIFSPLLDLKEQKQRAVNYRIWFNKRFSKSDDLDFSFESLTKQKKGSILCIYSQKDEVLGSLFSIKLSTLSSKIWTVIPQMTQHTPKTFDACFARFNQAYLFLIT